MYVRAGRTAFARPYVGVHRSTSLLQQCPACLVRLTWIVFVMGGRWPYSWFFVGCCLHDLFNIARSIQKKEKLINNLIYIYIYIYIYISERMCVFCYIKEKWNYLLFQMFVYIYKVDE